MLGMNNGVDTCRLRNIRKTDFTSITNLLGQLTDIEIHIDNMKHKEQFDSFIDYIDNTPNHIIKILEDEENRVIGMGTILIEPKIIHCFSNIAHIEDIVIDRQYRGKSYGSFLIHKLIEDTKQHNCYKVVLYCKEHMKSFYEKNGLYQGTNVHLELRN